jgi:mRNA interferase YafQ
MKFRTTTQFEKEYKRAEKRGMDISKLDAVMQKIINNEPIERKYRDHLLTGNFKDRRECHIEPDWLLIYKIDKEKQIIIFERTGSHSDIFG